MKAWVSNRAHGLFDQIQNNKLSDQPENSKSWISYCTWTFYTCLLWFYMFTKSPYILKTTSTIKKTTYSKYKTIQKQKAWVKYQNHDHEAWYCSKIVWFGTWSKNLWFWARALLKTYVFVFVLHVFAFYYFSITLLYFCTFSHLLRVWRTLCVKTSEDLLKVWYLRVGPKQKILNSME